MMITNHPASVCAGLLARHPDLLTCQLSSWLAFFSSYGLNSDQIRDILAQAPEVLTKGSIHGAGNAIGHLKSLGFDDDEVIHRVIAFQPRVLMQSNEDIDTLIRLWSKFSVGVNENGGPSC
jgi:hypothetical protein